MIDCCHPFWIPLLSNEVGCQTFSIISQRFFYTIGNTTAYSVLPACWRGLNGLTVNDQVLRVIHTHINVYTDNLALIKKINSRKDNVEQYTIFNKEVKRLQKELDRLATDRQRLYEDYVTKIIDSEQYVKFKKEYEEREKYYKAEYAEMFEARARYDTKYKTNKEWDDLINSFRDKRLLTKKMVDAFVKKVSIDEDGNAEVELVYDDMLADLVKFAREREKENEKN